MPEEDQGVKSVRLYTWGFAGASSDDRLRHANAYDSFL